MNKLSSRHLKILKAMERKLKNTQVIAIDFNDPETREQLRKLRLEQAQVNRKKSLRFDTSLATVR